MSAAVLSLVERHMRTILSGCRQNTDEWQASFQNRQHTQPSEEKTTIVISTVHPQRHTTHVAEKHHVCFCALQAVAISAPTMLYHSSSALCFTETAEDRTTRSRQSRADRNFPCVSTRDTLQPREGSQPSARDQALT